MSVALLIWILVFIGLAVFALCPLWVRRGNGVTTCITCGDPIRECDEGFCKYCYVGDCREDDELLDEAGAVVPSHHSNTTPPSSPTGTRPPISDVPER